MSCACENETKAPQSCASTETERWIQPRADVVENSDGFVVTLDVPGVAKGALDVTLDDRTLTVVGRRESGLVGETLHRESKAAGFRRAFTLGEAIDPSGITAGLQDGVARLTLPKAVEAKPRRITVAG